MEFKYNKDEDEHGHMWEEEEDFKICEIILIAHCILALLPRTRAVIKLAKMVWLQTFPTITS